MSEPLLRTTIVAPATVEIDPIKGSRFIGDAVGVDDEVAAMAAVATVRDREAGASHHCWAFRLEPDDAAPEEPGRARSDDDGEPGGTAGPPILQRIDGRGLDGVLVVVTRYYGGTNLGAGGLIRAYGAAAAAVLEAVRTEVRPVATTFVLVHAYDLTGPVQGVLAAHDAEVVESAYGAETRLRVAVPLHRADAFVAALRDATAGAVLPERA